MFRKTKPLKGGPMSQHCPHCGRFVGHDGDIVVCAKCGPNALERALARFSFMFASFFRL